MSHLALSTTSRIFKILSFFPWQDLMSFRFPLARRKEKAATYQHTFIQFRKTGYVLSLGYSGDNSANPTIELEYRQGAHLITWLDDHSTTLGSETLRLPAVGSRRCLPAGSRPMPTYYVRSNASAAECPSGNITGNQSRIKSEVSNEFCYRATAEFLVYTG